jgi:hypothetical protein
MKENCKTIWGNDFDYSFDIETDDYMNWACHVQKDFGTSFEPPLIMAASCSSEVAAWGELDRMLSSWATQIQSDTPMTKDESLYIFGGPRGEYQSLLNDVMNLAEKKKGAKDA